MSGGEFRLPPLNINIQLLPEPLLSATYPTSTAFNSLFSPLSATNRIFNNIQSTLYRK